MSKIITVESIEHSHKLVQQLSKRINKVLLRFVDKIEPDHKEVGYLIAQRALNLSIARSTNKLLWLDRDFDKMMEQVFKEIEDARNSNEL